MTPAERARIRAARAALAFALAAPLAYVGQRVYERARGSTITPFRILRDLHVGYFYRVAIATFLGCVVAATAHAILELRDGSDDGSRSTATLVAAWVTGLVVAALAWGAP